MKFVFLYPTASSSSSFPNWISEVFSSFTVVDVHKNFLSHFLRELDRKYIKDFKDNRIERGRSLELELKLGMKNSRIAVIVFSLKLHLFKLVPQRINVASCFEKLYFSLSGIMKQKRLKKLSIMFWVNYFLTSSKSF